MQEAHQSNQAEKKESFDKNRHFHYSILVFAGGIILTFLLWDAYLNNNSQIEKSVASPLILAMGSLFSIAAGLFVWSLESRQGFMEREVHKRTVELENKNQELQEKNKEIENFIHIISHDLKAPLVSIQGFASILKNELGAALQGANLDYFNRIVTNAKNMTVLLQDLLEFSRVGRIEDEKEKVDMNSLFQEIVGELRPEIEKKKIQVKNAGRFPALLGTKKRLHQVFMNLVGNSVKYIGDPNSPTITLGCRENGSFYEFQVRDNGVGIPQEAQSKVFQIFQRFHPGMGIEGTGVGLSIVKKIVETNGGSVRFESAPGVGTTFFVTWPKGRNG
ncbi:MAG: HAMP domain-containing histidine kinase [Candidatus Omnitrophica bacterium]|nr:HAMP domain-containing histidine kinase [Candidatus Omnitrophota bacterium]